ncbi:MAG TPA: 23S rRNA (adenine(2030)-N(6))-methyltransferase RlmJ [Caulobacteraceae bacterium]|jgi:23S rRNA (adenine2030-N6)-methyltransferase
MNYRHAFHAGNFADLFKHAVLLELLAKVATAPGPLTVIDTHAGAGAYDLGSDAARRTGEGSAASVLMAEEASPGVFAPLKSAVGRLNQTGERRYPGSPLLIAQALRARDQLIACETSREDFEILREILRRPAGSFAVREDGWEVARLRTPRSPASVLVLIDPPYEAAGDPQRAAQALGQVLGRNAKAVVAVWAPLKDLASFDALLSDLEDAARGLPMLVAEARLRPPDDPLRLNGCAMIVVNPTPDLEAKAREAADWIAQAFGGGIGVGRVTVFDARAVHRQRRG